MLFGTKDEVDEYTKEKIRKHLGRRRKYVKFDVHRQTPKGKWRYLLDDIAVRGKVIFRRPENIRLDKKYRYESKEIDSPNWLDVAEIANESIIKTGDYHHYLEGVERHGKYVDLIMGS